MGEICVISTGLMCQCHIKLIIIVIFPIGEHGRFLKKNLKQC